MQGCEIGHYGQFPCSWETNTLAVLAVNNAMNKKKVAYREPLTGPRSPGIVHRQSAINNKLAPKPAPKPTLNLTLTLL